MAKSERRRTIVYSNVNKKKADSKSASKNKNIIDLDDEIVIGLDNIQNKSNISNTKKGSKLKKAKKVQASPKNKNNSTQNTNKKNNEKSTESKVKTKKIEVNMEKESKPKMTKQEIIKRQKIKIIKKISITFVLLIICISAIIYFFLSPIFNIKSINVVNNNQVSVEQIINSSEIKVNENTFKFSKREAKKKILSNPYIDDVKISRNIFSNKVEIDVKERIATLMLEYGNSYVYINNQGYILEISQIKLDTPILKGYVTPLDQVKPGNRLNKEDLERLEKVLSIIEIANSNEIGELISSINIKDKNNYIMNLDIEDKIVYLGNCSDLSTQMLYIKDMIQREKGKEGEFFVDMNLTYPVFREKV